MAGLETISNGEAALAPGASVGILLQEPVLDPAKDVLGNVKEGVAPTRALLARFEELSLALGEAGPDEMDRLLEDYAKVQDAIEAASAWDLDAQLEMAMDALRLPPGDAEVTTLSGGERRRVALCRLLLSRPDLLLLDEPTNHLDAESVQWLEQHLAAYPGTVLAVTHDRYFLDNVAGWILELDRGRAYPYEGNYSTYLESRRPGWPPSRGPAPAAGGSWSGSWSGSGPGPRAATTRAGPGCGATRSWPPRPSATARSTSTRSRSRPAPASATWSSRPTG